MKHAKKFSVASLTVALGIFLVTGVSRAQEAPPAGRAGESRSAGARSGPAAEAKKEDPGAAPAQFTQGLLEQIGGAKVAMDTMWTLIAGMLVFFMNLGFATVESGLVPREEHRHHSRQELYRVCGFLYCLFGSGLGIDVWRWQSIFWDSRALVRWRRRQ